MIELKYYILISLVLFMILLFIIVFLYCKLLNNYSNSLKRISQLESKLKYVSDNLVNCQLKLVDYKHDCSSCTTRTLNIINAHFKELEEKINSVNNNSN